MTDVNPFSGFIRSLLALIRGGVGYALGQQVAYRAIKQNPEKRAVILAPHPDDETIIGLWPLRLLRECDWEIVNVAVTLGSNMKRRRERLKELRDACGYLGFRLVETAPGGLEHVSDADADEMTEKNINVLAEILRREKPRVVFMPHVDDGHPTHIGTHLIGTEALKRLGDHKPIVVYTEFWHPLRSPNTLIEGSQKEVADLTAALSLHRGEVKRNPYHVFLPFEMAVSMRRGAELIGGFRGTHPESAWFGTLYRVKRCDTVSGEKVEKKVFVSCSDSPETPLL